MDFTIGTRQTKIPPGDYSARVVEVKEGTFIGKRKSLQFAFEIADGDYQGTQLRGWVNAHYESFSEHTKLFRWYSNVCKDDMDVGEKKTTKVFFDKILKIKVETKISKKTQNEFSNVTDILGVIYDLE